MSWTKQDQYRTRKSTCKLLELAEQGVITWEQVARDAMSYMSEDEVADMARINGYFDYEDGE